MAKKAESVAEPSENKKRDYSKRRWMIPSKRAKGYAEERKKGVHMRGEKNGEELSDFDKGLVRVICFPSLTVQEFTSTKKRLQKAKPKIRQKRFRKEKAKIKKEK